MLYVDDMDEGFFSVCHIGRANLLLGLRSEEGIKLRIDVSSRTSLTGLSVLLRNAIFIFTLMNPVGSILGRRHRFRVRP